ncbi:bublin coiled-coil protein [Ixodes scapularis]|uniref:bublin coiled-coil protein n=1 Tax=Ixodes scapularis TaxID=6945 RepID=UPI001A9E8803|nr:bublin coiled-coil protein [Ixodes scapularis]
MARSDDGPKSSSASGDQTTAAEGGSEVDETSYDEEYEALNAAMDEINACLDHIEQKNNDLFAQMRQFLEATKQEEMELEEDASVRTDDSGYQP